MLVMESILDIILFSLMMVKKLSSKLRLVKFQVLLLEVEDTDSRIKCMFMILPITFSQFFISRIPNRDFSRKENGLILIKWKGKFKRLLLLSSISFKNQRIKFFQNLSK